MLSSYFIFSLFISRILHTFAASIKLLFPEKAKDCYMCADNFSEERSLILRLIEGMRTPFVNCMPLIKTV